MAAQALKAHPATPAGWAFAWVAWPLYRPQRGLNGRRIVYLDMSLVTAVDRVPRFLRSFYFLTGAAFLVWMFLFDANDFVKQYDMYAKWQELDTDKDYYLREIDKVKKERAELLSSPELLEKFAREKYIMKRPGEDVFVLVPQEKE
jgi:cell division protein DivIC